MLLILSGKSLALEFREVCVMLLSLCVSVSLSLSLALFSPSFLLLFYNILLQNTSSEQLWLLLDAVQLAGKYHLSLSPS